MIDDRKHIRALKAFARGNLLILQSAPAGPFHKASSRVALNHAAWQFVAGGDNNLVFGSARPRNMLTSRKLLQRKLLDVEADLRGTLRNFGLKVGVVSRSRYEVRISELVKSFPRLAAIVGPLLAVRRVMRQQLAVLHNMLLDTVRGDPVCRRLMTAPGVGAVVALTYRATVDQPQRFVHSRAVGAHVGLTPKRYQSGEVDYDGGVSKCGDALLRTMLYEAAHALLTRRGKWSWLKAWGVRVAQRRGMRRAIVAVARRLAVVLHRMWVDGSEFRWSKDSTAVPAVA